MLLSFPILIAREKEDPPSLPLYSEKGPEVKSLFITQLETLLYKTRTQ